MMIPRWADAVNEGFNVGAASVLAYISFTKGFVKNFPLSDIGLIEYGVTAAWPLPGGARRSEKMGIQSGRWRGRSTWP